MFKMTDRVNDFMLAVFDKYGMNEIIAKDACVFLEKNAIEKGSETGLVTRRLKRLCELGFMSRAGRNCDKKSSAGRNAELFKFIVDPRTHIVSINSDKPKKDENRGYTESANEWLYRGLSIPVSGMEKSTIIRMR